MVPMSSAPDPTERPDPDPASTSRPRAPSPAPSPSPPPRPPRAPRPGPRLGVAPPRPPPGAAPIAPRPREARARAAAQRRPGQAGRRGHATGLRPTDLLALRGRHPRIRDRAGDGDRSDRPDRADRLVVDRSDRYRAPGPGGPGPGPDPAPGESAGLPRRGRGAHHRQRDPVPRGLDHPLRPHPVGEDRRGTGGPPLRTGQADHVHRGRRFHGHSAGAAQGGGRAAAPPGDRARHREDGGAVSTAQPTPPTIPPPRPATTAHRRTHPITPLVTGWKIVVGVIAVITAQNIARLIEDFTITRALIGAGLLVAAVIIAVEIGRAHV